MTDGYRRSAISKENKLLQLSGVCGMVYSGGCCLASIMIWNRSFIATTILILFLPFAEMMIATKCAESLDSSAD